MSRSENPYGNRTLLQCPEYRSQTSLVISHMKHHNAWFSTEHSRHTGFACNLNQLILRHIRCPVIRDCQLHTQNLLHKYNISIYLACKRRAGISVSTCKHISTHALFTECSGLRVKIVHTPGDSICAQKSHHCCDTILYQL